MSAESRVIMLENPTRDRPIEALFNTRSAYCPRHRHFVGSICEPGAGEPSTEQRARPADRVFLGLPR